MTDFQQWGVSHLPAKARTSCIVYGALGPYKAQASLSPFTSFKGTASHLIVLPLSVGSNIIGKQALSWGSNLSLGAAKTLPHGADSEALPP